MSLVPGTRVGPYEIVGPLGAGGMGQVYRARDPRLGREVAIKALPADVAQSPDRRARFEREAQLLASLNHPNIATIHGLEEVDGAKYLVLELVDGRTLDAVMSAAGGRLPVGEAVGIATQIAEAVATAHERGIIHRDLKPGNVMVTGDGKVKVLDFGLGKALDSDVSRSEPSISSPHSPTLTMAATSAGLILGTAGYMSPEQAKGRPADRRSDVWGFGCLLYEMLSGKRAFDGEDVTDVLAHIVRGEPDWDALPKSLPPSLRSLIQRCLVKDRAQRLSDMSVVRFLLQEPAPAAPAARQGETRRRIGWPVVAGLVTIAVLVTAGITSFLSPASAPDAATPLRRLSVVLPNGDVLSGLNFRPLAVAPDGGSVVYVATRNGASQLYRRALDGTEAVPLSGTDSARNPFFSPDGRWIAFFSIGQLKKVTVGGTGVQLIAAADDARGGCWGPVGNIYFAASGNTGISRVSAEGGKVEGVTRVERPKGEISHRWPLLLPDGEHLLFTVWTGPGADEHQIVVQSLRSGERKVLVRGGDTAAYFEGHLLYGRGDALFAVPWTPGQKAGLEGVAPVALPELPRLENEGASDFSVGSDGTLAFLPGGPGRVARRIVWVSRTGDEDPLPLPEREYEGLALSPDEKQAVLQIQEGVITLWMYDFSRRTLTPFVTAEGSSQAPVWSPDGSRVFYRGTRKGTRNVYVKAADGTGAEERLTADETAVETPTSLTADGQWLAFNRGQAGLGAAFLMRLGADRASRELLGSGRFNGQISPDGRWIAYQSVESGRSEVYIQPFPGPGPRRQLSVGGGAMPRWAPDGRELYFTSQNGFMTLSVGSGAALSIGAPVVLHADRYFGSLNGNTPYAVAKDGRFLHIQTVRNDPGLTHIEVVLNWSSQLKKGVRPL